MFWICSPKWVFLILPRRALFKPRAWPGNSHRTFLYSNSLTHQLGIFFCHIWRWGFSGGRQQSLHFCVYEPKTLPVGDSLDQQPRPPGCGSPCANTPCRGLCPENCTPNHKVMYGFGLASPPNFYGVLLCGDHIFPQNIEDVYIPSSLYFFFPQLCVVRLVQADIIWVLQTTKRRQSWSDFSWQDLRSDPDLQLRRSCECCCFAQTTEPDPC